VGALLVGGLALGGSAAAAGAQQPDDGPFVPAPIDAQNWELQQDMTWDDWTDIPGTQWNDPTVKPSVEALNIALVAVDFPDQKFVITKPKGSDLFGNPQIDPIARDDVPDFYRDFYMKPSELNHGRTVQEYWMEMSRGQYGVDFMDSYGPYQLDRNLFEYGLNEFPENDQPGACPEDFTCNGRMDNDVVTKWKAGMAAESGMTPDAWCAQKTAELGGSARNCGYDVILRIYAGYDETSIWQEFGQMMFPNKESIPDEWGPPAAIKGDLPNWAGTRYVAWTSWQAAAQQWGLSSIRQAESSGTITHEMGHYFFSIGDNNNNPFSEGMTNPSPYHRVGAAPWDMFDRGSFNGPGGHHMRWVVPANMGGWSPAGLLLRNKIDMGIVPDQNVLTVTSDELAQTGVVVDTVTARETDPGETGTSGIRVLLGGGVNAGGGDLTPKCDINTNPLCDGNDPASTSPRSRWNDYTLEVVDRMGFDSFTPDSGVLIAKNKEVQQEGSSCGYNCFNWVIDANPQDIGIVDYYKPTEPGKWATGGEPVMATIADHRQLNDAAFKAGLNSGSKYEWVDEANRLHFYVIDLQRNDEGVLEYTLAVRSLDGDGPHTRGVEGTDAASRVSDGVGVCTFDFTNTGIAADVSGVTQHSDVTDKVGADVFRLTAGVDGDGWTTQLDNELATSADGETFSVPVYVTRANGSDNKATVSLTAVSESDPSKTATATCAVKAAQYKGNGHEKANGSENGKG
jgi:M6 family metalloprotease-like protein